MAEAAGQHQWDDLLWRHLKSLPAFRALLRAVEARFYRAVDIRGPVLDLGCGDGHFAQMAFDAPLEAGVDPWWGPLQKARRSGAYRLQIQALGDALPFASASFASVISNSVLEHIEDIQPVLAEASRVLRPGGLLVVTMPSHLFTENLAGVRWFGDRYRRLFNAISRHAHTDPPEAWATRMARAGFRIRRWQPYFSPGALRALEIGHLQGVPSAVLHFLTGHWILAPWRGNLRTTERWLRPYYEEAPPHDGAYLFFVAEKVANVPVNTILPPARPFSLETLRQVDAAGGAAEPLPPLPPATVQEAVIAPGASVAGTGTEPRVAPARPSSRSVQLTLLLATLLFALLAQRVLTSRPATPWAGVRLYLVALLALMALILERRNPGRLRFPRWQALPPQRLLYPLALLVALLAQQFGGVSLYEESPLLALLFWLAAIGLGVYAFYDGAMTFAVPRPFLRWRTWFVPAGLFVLALLPRLVALGEHPFVVNGVEASLGLDALAIASGRIGNPFATAWLTNPSLPLFAQAIPLQLFERGPVAVRLLPALAGAATVPLIYVLGRRLWSEAAGLVAALMLAGAHWHVHYSRLGMTNILDPLLALLAVGLIVIAWQQGTRRAWLWAGLATGANAYVYTSSRLFPYLLAALFVYFLLFERRSLVTQGRHMLAGLGLAAVVALPLWRFYALNPGIYMERANTVGVIQTGWLAAQAAQSGESVLALAGRQLAQAALAFNYSLDTSNLYNPGVPLLGFWPGLFFVLGSAVALVRFRQLSYALLLIWTSVTVLFAGALLVDPPASHRLLFAASAVYLLAALGLVEVARLALALWNRRPASRSVLVALGVLAALIAANDLYFYFGPYRAAYRFGDRNTEIADGVAAYLQELPPAETVVYFHGPPVMYGDFPTIPFLAPAFERGANFFDVEDPAAPLPVEDGSLVFIYIPERGTEVEQTQARLPGGEVGHYPGHFADPLFYTYEVQP